MENIHRERVKLIIIYDYADVPGEYTPGTEIVAIILIWRGVRYWIPLGPTHLVVVDFLCRHRWIALDTWQIAAKMQLDPFVLQHGANAPGDDGRPARTSRNGARQQMKRIRDVVIALIAGEGLDLDVEEVIRRERSSSGTTRYRIVADVVWEELPVSGAGSIRDPRVPILHPGVLGISNAQHAEEQL